MTKTSTSKSTLQPEIIQQRLVLVLQAAAEPLAQAATLTAALSGGDVASVIIVQGSLDEAAFLNAADVLVPVAQAANAAAIIAGDTRAIGRSGADGIHLTAEPRHVADAIKKANGKSIVGANAGKTRDQALDVGEERPDYVFIGKLDGDTHEDPHPRNLEMAEWWAEIIEIPAIIMAGNTVKSVAAAAATGAEFIALSQAVFGSADPKAAVAEASAILSAKITA
jgi:thiamine-phosphate pyrophosphorylase